MSNRLALPLIALFLLAIASWVILSDGMLDSDVDSSVAQGGSSAVSEADRGPIDPSELVNNDADTPLGRTDLPNAEHSTVQPLTDAARNFTPSFRGKVVDENGRPVAGVEIFAMAMLDWARGWDTARNVLPIDWGGKTDANGVFELPEPPRERLRFMLEFRHPELATFELFNQPSNPGRTRDLGVLTMDVGFSLAGVVLDPNGGAVANARVTPFRGDGPNGFDPRATDKRALLESVLTDERGRFTLRRLPTQPVRLLAEAESYFEAWSESANGDSGEDLQGMKIQLSTATTISGFVLDETRRPLVAAKVEVRDGRWEEGAAESPFLATTESAAQGRFSLLIPDGVSRAYLTVGAEGFYVGFKRIDDNIASAPIEVVLTPIDKLIGVVVDGAGAAVGGATVALLRSRNDNIDPRNAPPNVATISDSNGGFELLPNLKSSWGGRFVVYAWDDDHAIGASQLLRIRESANSLPELRVVLERGFRAAGVVVKPDGETMAGARVQLRKLRRPRNSRLPNMNESQRGGDIVERAITGADGSFAFVNLPSGDYRLETYANGYSPAQSEDFGLVDMDFKVELQLIESCGISGEIVGDISAFSQLRISADAPGMDRLEVFADGDGRFDFPEMMPGTWNLSLTDASDLTANPTFSFSGGEPLARAAGIEVVGGQTTAAVIELDIGGLGQVSGSVRINGKLQANYAVFVVPQLSAGSNQGGIGQRNIMRQMRSVATDFRGRFTIAGLEPNDYWILVEQPGGWPDLRFEAGNSAPSALQRGQLHLPDAAAVEYDFDVYLGSLQVNTKDPNSRTSATIRLEPSPADGRRSRTARLNKRGYTFTDIPSGTYNLLVRINDEWQSYSASVPSLSMDTMAVNLPEANKKKDNNKKPKR